MKMIGKTITLSDEDQELCIRVAREICENSKRKNVRNRKIGSRSDEWTELNGTGGECGFCRMFGTKFDDSIRPRSSVNGTDHGDTVLHDLTIDVKTTHWATGRLVVGHWKNSSIDLFALMIGEFPTYTFMGFMIASDLIKPEKQREKFKGGYTAEQSELREFEEIIQELQWPY
jgi:hypothetical protein